MASFEFTQQQHHPVMMTCPNIYHTHPFYRQQPFFHPLTTTSYREENEFRPSFYNPFEIKHRRRTSRAQLKVLEKSFLENAKPNASVRRSLAQELDMTPRGVQIWFQNRRAKTKLQNKKSLQQQQQQQQQVAQHTPTSKSNNNSFSMAPFNSSSLESVSPLFYPVGADLASQDQTMPSLFMSDQSWLAMPMHPLSYSPSSSSSCSSSSSSSSDKDQGIMNLSLSSSYLPSPTTPMFSSTNEALMTGLSPCSDGTLYSNHTQQQGWPASTQYQSSLLSNCQEQQRHELALFDYQHQRPFACGLYPTDPVPFDYRNC